LHPAPASTAEAGIYPFEVHWGGIDDVDHQSHDVLRTTTCGGDAGKRLEHRAVHLSPVVVGTGGHLLVGVLPHLA
jgi:hypothetical protein